MAGVAALSDGPMPAGAEAPGTAHLPANTGRPAGGGFLVDFTKGFDPVTHIRADWDAAADWMAASFRKENAEYGASGLTLLELQQLARALTDVQAAEELNEARQALFRRAATRTG